MNSKWIVNQQEFNRDQIQDNGNRFLIGNGYMGIRGTLDEFSKEQLVAVNLAGIYDKAGDGWREPLNAFNPLYVTLSVDGEKCNVFEDNLGGHSLTLNYKEAILYRTSTYNTHLGKITYSSKRFLDMENPHRIYGKYEITADFDGSIKFETGIDTDIWEIYGPHYVESKVWLSDILTSKACIQGDKEQVFVLEDTQSNLEASYEEKDKKHLHSYAFTAKKGETYSFYKQCAVYTSKDKEVVDKELRVAPEDIFARNLQEDFQNITNSHIDWWAKKWDLSAVEIEGDEEGEAALNYSLYHLHSIAPRHKDSMSIAARGLSGQTYKGAVFWDTEMFILDFFLYTEPKVARTIMKYRIDTLPGAIKKAREYGYEGAFYAWESQEGGIEGCTDYNVVDVFTKRPMRTYFRDRQIHISAAIVYGISRYVEITKDYSILEEGGSKTIIECAKFYYDLLLKRVNRKYYELHDVIGPDEYHEHVNNNGYTNRMAKFTFEKAVWVLENKEYREKSSLVHEAERKILLNQFKDAARNIYIPAPDEEGIIPQFDGYRSLEDVSVDEVRSRLIDEKEYWGGAYGVAAQTQVIKQADVVTLLTLFSNEYSKNVLEKNWKYYEKRTEHGSSLSACMYALLACKCGWPDIAYPFFLQSATADLRGGGKQWAGLIYIGGSHPAASGGAYMNAIKGFAGVSFEDDKIKVNPMLPSKWKKMKFTLCYENNYYDICIDGNDYKITKRD